MSSFININNKDFAPEAKYSAEVIKAALLVSETKSTTKADSLTKNIEDSLSLNEALELFTDKLKAVKSLTQSSHIIALKEAAALEASKTELTLEGTMSEIHILAQEAKDIVDFTKKFFKEFGDKIKKSADSTQWVESLYTDTVSEDHSENPNDIYDVRPCDKAGTPWSVWEGDVQVKCFETEEEAVAYATEQNKKQGLTEGYDGDMSDFKYEFPMRFEEETGNSPKAIKKMAKQGRKGYEVRTSTYTSRTEMERVGLVLGLNLKSYTKHGHVNISVYESTIINEDFSRMSSGVIGNELYAASQALTTYYDWLKAGNDSGKGKSLDHIISLLKKCKSSIKRFKTKEETIGTEYEAPMDEATYNESIVTEAKFKKGQYIKAKSDSDDFDGDVYDRTNEVDGSEIKKGASFEIRKINGGETILWSDDEVEYSIETDDLKHFVKESIVNEGRSINKIQTEWSQTTTDMVQKVTDWKAAEGDRKIELLEELKALTAKKKELEIELDAKVAGKDKDVKLAIEGNTFESIVNEKYEVIYSDGIVQGKRFRSEQQAIDFMKKEIASNKYLRDIAVYKPGMHSTTQTELVVKFWGDGSYLDNASKGDKKLATKKLEESIVTDKPSWDDLLEEFEIVETTNEDIRSDVKKWIRTNKEELNDLADVDEWDTIHDKLYSEFGVEADSIKAKDLLKTFQFVF